MEVGWYLRFSKTDRVEAMVTAKTAPQVRHEAHIFRDWIFEFQDKEDHVLARMTRRKPLYKDEDSA
ncbi:hypothetical protein [Pseudodesulfovibrio piezophilus]|uniref:Uncharacterized protein n=1 Tax=Pseudodesulfovibrio piezophilus (strain DSM 21447 / JCM 15486 / C1TLV30) TaxID=1322246 RepID=M1WLV8_PSEP2|nr:hypothetical protein [Pseudodesulfovibrio piezophilus]CCH48535.1 protein of unknown function [Pseudodesulfovibrio piezophilus C1TLV30]